MTSVLLAASAAIASVDAGTAFSTNHYTEPVDHYVDDPDNISKRPMITKIILIGVFSLGVGILLTVVLWNMIRKARSPRHRYADVEVEPVARTQHSRSRTSRRQSGHIDPPPPYSEPSPMPVDLAALERLRMATIDGVEDNHCTGNTRLPSTPAPAYKL